jgi:hypothetical protein
MRLGQELLQTEAGDAEGERQGCDAEAYPNCHHQARASQKRQSSRRAT